MPFLHLCFPGRTKHEKKQSHVMTGNIPNSKTLPRVTWPENLFVQVWNLTCAFFLPYVLGFDAIDWHSKKEKENQTSTFGLKLDNFRVHRTLKLTSLNLLIVCLLAQRQVLVSYHLHRHTRILKELHTHKQYSWLQINYNDNQKPA